jgi:hypothetical protein
LHRRHSVKWCALLPGASDLSDPAVLVGLVNFVVVRRMNLQSARLRGTEKKFSRSDIQLSRLGT